MVRVSVPGGARWRVDESPVLVLEYAAFAAAIMLRLASDSSVGTSYAILGVIALFGRRQAIQALGLSWLFTMFNPGFAPEASATMVGRFAPVLAAAASLVLRAWLDGVRSATALRVQRFTLFTLALGVFLIVHSFLFSPLIDVSILKAASWTIAMASLTSAWQGMGTEEWDRLSRQVYGGLCVVLLASIPLLVLPVGYLRNGTGFQGVLNHPQAFGLVMALLGAWAGGRFLGEARPSWRLVAVAAACAAMIVASEARTAGLAMPMGIVGTIMLAPLLSGRSVRGTLPGLRSRRAWAVGAAAVAISLTLAPTIYGAARNFITKSGRAEVDSIVGAYEASRGLLIDRMLDNVRDRPLTGIGFGIPSLPDSMDVRREPLLGLPVGVAIEKGVAPIAVLEEVGVVGAAAVLVWVLSLMHRSARNGPAQFAVCLTALLINLGEFTLFSVGGMGLLSLLLFGWAMASGRPCRARDV